MSVYEIYMALLKTDKWLLVILWTIADLMKYTN